MTKVLRWMLCGIALLIIGTWGAALHETGTFYEIVAVIAPIAGILCIIVSFLETD